MKLSPNPTNPVAPAFDPVSDRQNPLDIENRSVIASLQAENESLKAQLDAAQRIARVDAMLIKAGAKNPACVRALIDIVALQADANGSFPALESAIATIKEEEPYLFHENHPAGLFGFRPTEGWKPSDSDPFVRGFLGL